MIRKLKLSDRFIIVDLLSFTKGNFKTMLVVESIIGKVKITLTEVELYQIEVSDNGAVKWNSEGESSLFDIEFSEIESNEIKNKLRKLSEENKLTIDLLSLCRLIGFIE